MSGFLQLLIMVQTKHIFTQTLTRVKNKRVNKQNFVVNFQQHITRDKRIMRMSEEQQSQAGESAWESTANTCQSNP